MARRLHGFLLLVVLAVGAACVTVSDSAKLDPLEYRWPPEAPRIGLDRVIRMRSDAAPRGLLGWLGGVPDEGLFRRPYGVAWEGENLLVTDQGAGRLMRLRAPKGVDLSVEGLFQAPTGVTVCGGGIVVSDPPAGRVALLDTDLRLVEWIGEELVRPTGVACLGGRIVVVETGRHRLLVFESSTPTALGRRGDGPGEFNFPTSVVAEGDALWVGDTLNSRLQKIDPSTGELLVTFGRLGEDAGEMPRIKGIAIDREGQLWVSDAVLDQVAIYNREGAFLISLGRTGDEPGELAFPAGLAAHPDGRVAVVDSLNRRLQVFRLLSLPEGSADD